MQTQFWRYGQGSNTYLSCYPIDFMYNPNGRNCKLNSGNKFNSQIAVSRWTVPWITF